TLVQRSAEHDIQEVIVCFGFLSRPEKSFTAPGPPTEDGQSTTQGIFALTCEVSFCFCSFFLLQMSTISRCFNVMYLELELCPACSVNSSQIDPSGCFSYELCCSLPA